MAHSQFDQFLQEATYPDQESDWTLDADTFYGLYTSWCYVTHRSPQLEHVFWAAMSQRANPAQCLRMKGPAAADYILSSYPAVV
ncbi:hypothetical protein M1D93_00615 [Arthrobacter sp. Z1-9]